VTRIKQVNIGTAFLSAGITNGFLWLDTRRLVLIRIMKLGVDNIIIFGHHKLTIDKLRKQTVKRKIG